MRISRRINSILSRNASHRLASTLAALDPFSSFASHLLFLFSASDAEIFRRGGTLQFVAPQVMTNLLRVFGQRFTIIVFIGADRRIDGVHAGPLVDHESPPDFPDAIFLCHQKQLAAPSREVELYAVDRAAHEEDLITLGRSAFAVDLNPVIAGQMLLFAALLTRGFQLLACDFDEIGRLALPP